MRQSVSGVIATVRHRTASGRLDEMWEYDPTRRVVILVLSVGADPISLDVAVCGNANPIPDRWILVRQGGGRWRLTPSVAPRDAQSLSRPMPLHPDLPTGSIDLISAPDDVESELAKLYEVRS